MLSFFNLLVGRSVSFPLKLSKASAEGLNSSKQRSAANGPALSLILRSTGALKSSTADRYLSLDPSVHRGIASGLQIELCATFDEKDFSVIDEIAVLSQDIFEKSSEPEPEPVAEIPAPTQSFSWADDTEDSDWDTDDFFFDWQTPAASTTAEAANVFLSEVTVPFYIAEQTDFSSEINLETLLQEDEEECDDRFVDISVFRRPSRPNWSFPQLGSNIRHRDEMRRYAIYNSIRRQHKEAAACA